MTALLRALLERLVSQEVARSNAAQAYLRLAHDRRELEDVEAFLSQHVLDQANGQQPRSAGLSADPASARAELHDVETQRAITHGG